MSEDQEGKSSVQCENNATEHGKETRNLKIVASTLLVASSSVHQCIPTSKKSTHYFGVRVALYLLISERIALTLEGLSDFLEELEHLKKFVCILTFIFWPCSFESLEGSYDILIVEVVIFLGGPLSLFSIDHFEYHGY